MGKVKGMCNIGKSRSKGSFGLCWGGLRERNGERSASGLGFKLSLI